MHIYRVPMERENHGKLKNKFQVWKKTGNLKYFEKSGNLILKYQGL